MAGEVELKGHLYNSSGVAVPSAAVSAYAPGTTTPAIDTTTTDANGMWRFDAGGSNALVAPATGEGYDIEVVSSLLKLRTKFEDKQSMRRMEVVELTLRDSGDATHRALLSAPTLTGDRAVSFPDADGPVLVRNEGGLALDQRIEGDTDANLLYVDAVNDRVGIGTATPASKLSVNGSIDLPDNSKMLLGSGQDASIYYDGVDLQFNPAEVGSGAVVMATTRVGLTAGDSAIWSVSGTSVANAGTITKTLPSRWCGFVMATQRSTGGGIGTYKTYTLLKTATGDIVLTELGTENFSAGAGGFTITISGENLVMTNTYANITDMQLMGFGQTGL